MVGNALIQAQNTFNVTLDENNLVESGQGIVETQSGTFLVVGRIRLPLSYEDTIAIRKLDTFGNLLWVKKHVLAPNSGHWAANIFPLPSGNYVVAGSVTNDTINYSDNPYLLEIDSMGNMVSFHHYGSEFEEVGACATRAADGGFYLGGWSDRYANVANQNSDAYVIKTDSNYTMQWIQYFQRPKTNTAYDIYATPDTGCIVLTGNEICCYENDASLIKLDQYGTIQWEHNYMTPDKNYAATVTGTQDNGYLIATHKGYGFENHSKAYIAKVDNLGGIVWDFNLNLGYDIHTPRKVIQLADGSYIIAGIVGYYSPPLADLYGWLLKLSPEGEVLWSREFRHNPDILQNYFYGMTLCNDGGFALGGMVINDPPERNDVWVVKTDSLGNDCFSQPELFMHYYGANPINLALLPQQSITLSPQAFGGCPPYTYNWSGADAFYLDQTMVQHPQFSPPDTGTYTFYVTIADSDTLSLIDTLIIEVINDTSVMNSVQMPNLPVKSQEISIFPNPATTQATLYITQPTQAARFDLYDLSGKLLKSLALPDYAAEYRFSVADLPVGVYVCRVGDVGLSKLIVLK